jgi:hypothetical protein
LGALESVEGRSFATGEATLDVHAPHEPIHDVKDFLLHLLTITVGLLIAVGIEGCVELHREHKLVQEARVTLREEIEGNSKVMAEAVELIKKQKATMQKNVDALTKIMESPKDKSLQDPNIDASCSNKSLKDTAWKTAQTTGALSYMPYTEAQKYAEIYQAQAAFEAEEAKIVEDEAQLFGVLAKTNFGHGPVTPEQASLALERFGIWQGHLVYLNLMARLSSMSDVAFLEGREGPTKLTEEFGGGEGKAH